MAGGVDTLCFHHPLVYPLTSVIESIQLVNCLARTVCPPIFDRSQYGHSSVGLNRENSQAGGRRRDFLPQQPFEDHLSQIPVPHLFVSCMKSFYSAALSITSAFSCKRTASFGSPSQLIIYLYHSIYFYIVEFYAADEVTWF